METDLERAERFDNGLISEKEILEYKKRNLEYEKKFRAYLFKGNLERHKEICKNLNVKPNIKE